jgi:hypothetical protein
VTLVLPSAADLPPDQLGVTIGEPVVALVLPSASDLPPDQLGVTIGEPVVTLVLPSSPELIPGEIGLTVGQPAVTLFLSNSIAGPGGIIGEVPGSAGTHDVADAGGSSGGPAADLLVVRLLEVRPPVAPFSRSLLAAAGEWQVVLEWNGRSGARHVVESSTNLTEWTAVETEALPAAGDVLRARCGVQNPQATFYRVRRTN